MKKTKLGQALIDGLESANDWHKHSSDHTIILHKNLATGYAQALRGEGISTTSLKAKLKKKESALRKKTQQK